MTISSNTYHTRYIQVRMQKSKILTSKMFWRTAPSWSDCHLESLESSKTMFSLMTSMARRSGTWGFGVFGSGLKHMILRKNIAKDIRSKNIFSSLRKKIETLWKSGSCFISHVTISPVSSSSFSIRRYRNSEVLPGARKHTRGPTWFCGDQSVKWRCSLILMVKIHFSKLHEKDDVLIIKSLWNQKMEPRSDQI